VPVRVVGIPQRFLDHGKRASILKAVGLTGEGVAAAARSALR
jgi:1-deoxy-D-xylulose-5-phosphate synthase